MGENREGTAAPTIKEAILSVLSTEFPLSVNQLHLKVSRLINRTFSCQALYKCLKILTTKKAITKKNGRYFLSENYVQTIIIQAKQLEHLYETPGIPPLPSLYDFILEQEMMGPPKKMLNKENEIGKRKTSVNNSNSLCPGSENPETA